MKSWILALAIVATLCMTPLAIADNGDSASPITITDGLGKTVTLDSPAEHIYSIGKGTTATIIQLGCLDKIVLCDSYSKGDEPLFDGLKEKITAGAIDAGGNTYSSGLPQLKIEMLDNADPAAGGLFDKEKDVVFLVASKTYSDPVIEFLAEENFKNVLVWYEVVEYDDIVSFVEAVSLACTGEISTLAEQMSYVANHISDVLASDGRNKTKAFSITYSGSAYKVGNTGSLATALILAAGGNAFAVDENKAKPTYETNLTDLYDVGGSGTVVFLDTSIYNTPERLNYVQEALPDGALIYNMESLWNNYSVESMNGIWSMASAMYPDLFDGDLPEVPERSNDNTIIYIAGGAIAVIAICAIAFLFMRK